MDVAVFNRQRLAGLPSCSSGSLLDLWNLVNELSVYPPSLSFSVEIFPLCKRLGLPGDVLGSMGSRLEQLRAQRETILEIVSRNKACNVAVFGSVARRRGHVGK